MATGRCGVSGMEAEWRKREDGEEARAESGVHGKEIHVIQTGISESKASGVAWQSLVHYWVTQRADKSTEGLGPTLPWMSLPLVVGTGRR